MYKGYNIGRAMKKVVSIVVTLGIVTDLVYCLIKLVLIFKKFLEAAERFGYDIKIGDYISDIAWVVISCTLVAIGLWVYGLWMVSLGEMVERLTSIDCTLTQLKPYIIAQTNMAKQDKKNIAPNEGENIIVKPATQSAQPMQHGNKQSSEEQKPITAPKMWECIFCGQTNPSNVSLCQKCGMRGNIYEE